MPRLPIDINVQVDGADKIDGATGKLDALKDAGLAVGAGMLGAAAAIEGFNRAQQESNVAVGRLSLATGLQSSEIRTLATDVSNATFPLNEVLDLFELGTKRGVEGGQALKEYASFWDMVGDASGISSKTLAEGAVALEVLGIGIDNQNDLLPAYGYLLRHTTIGLDEFNDGIGKIAPRLDGMGVSVDEAAGILGILEERGITGKKALGLFGSAVDSADGDLATMLETLGITPDQFAAVNEKVQDSSGYVSDLADNYYENRTALQHLQSELDDFLFQNAEIAQAMDVVVPALGGAGMALMGLSQIGGLASGAMGALGSVMGFIVSPIGIVVVAIAALVAGFIWAYENVEWFRDLVDSAVRFIADLFGKFVPPIADLVGKVFGAILDIAGRTLGGLVDAVSGAVNMAVGAFGFLADIVGTVFGWISSTIGTAVNQAVGIFRGLLDGIVGIGRAIMDFVGGIFKPLADGFNTAVGFVKSLWNSFARFWNGIGIEVPSIDLPLIGKVGGFRIGLPPLPMLAEGGLVLGPTLALVGEAGPEAVIPLDRAGLDGGTTYEITVNAGVGDPVEIGRQVVAAIRAYERAGGRDWRMAGS